MDVAHRVGPRQVKQVVVAAHLAVPGVEARAAIALLVELERLDHGAHGAVEHEDALLGGLRKQSTNLGMGRCGHELYPGGCTSHSLSAVGTVVLTGRRPSRWQIA